MLGLTLTILAKKVPHQVGSTIPWAAFVAAAAALLVALLNAFYAQWAARRDRRRDLYSDAYKAAMAWVEMLYRVRRRDPSSEAELVDRFHTLQEEIAYFDGWLSTEASELASSYRSLVEAVRAEVSPLIIEAWQEQARPPAEGRREEDRDPDVLAASGQFLLDAREHLSLWPWVRRRVAQRNQRSEE